MRRTSLDVVMVVALFSVFAICALLLSLIGAHVYRGTASTMSQNYNSRTSVLYIAEKIRHNDIEGTIRIESLEGNDALVFTEKQSGKDYEIWLFVRDDMLYEGLFAPGAVPDVKLCQKIVPLKSMDASFTGQGKGMLSVSVLTTEDERIDIDLCLRSGREAET